MLPIFGTEAVASDLTDGNDKLNLHQNNLPEYALHEINDVTRTLKHVCTVIAFS
jgi:hypothetical protein